MHIRGKGYKPAVYSVKTWQKRYGIVKGQQDGRTHTKVYRVGSSKKAKAAAKWAKDNYYKKNYSYGINTKINSKNPTYCSKIVWQAYKSQNLVNTPKSKIATPYGLPGYFKSSAKIKGIGIL